MWQYMHAGCRMHPFISNSAFIFIFKMILPWIRGKFGTEYHRNYGINFWHFKVSTICYSSDKESKNVYTFRSLGFNTQCWFYIVIRTHRLNAYIDVSAIYSLSDVSLQSSGPSIGEHPGSAWVKENSVHNLSFFLLRRETKAGYICVNVFL